MTIFRVIDFETTGLEPPQAGICEIGWTDVHAAPETGVVIGESFSKCVDPGPTVHMNIEALAVHHIKEEEYRGRQRPDAVLSHLEADATVFVAHNAEFEQKFFKTKVPWICTMKCAHNCVMEAPSFSNQVLRYYLGHDLSPDWIPKRAEPVHRAAPDTYVTAWTFKVMLDRLVAELGDPSKAVGQMIHWTRQPAMPPRCPVGKWRGALWRDIDQGFLQWMVKNFKEEGLRQCALRELKRRGVA